MRFLPPSATNSTGVHEYDVTLKGLLQRSLTGSVLSDWVGMRIARWHNTDLPVVRSRRADLLGEDRKARLFHLGLQSRNDPDMALRMLEYATVIQRKYRRIPRQLVLCVGSAPLTMSGYLRTRHLSFRCPVTDIRELDSEQLLARAHLAFWRYWPGKVTNGT